MLDVMICGVLDTGLLLGLLAGIVAGFVRARGGIGAALVFAPHGRIRARSAPALLA